MTVLFSDGSASAKLVITGKGSGSDNAKTGDTTPVSHLIIAFALFILSLMQVAGTLCGYLANRYNSFEFAAAQAAAAEAEKALAILRENGVDAYTIGEIVRGENKIEIV